MTAPHANCMHHRHTRLRRWRAVAVAALALCVALSGASVEGIITRDDDAAAASTLSAASPFAPTRPTAPSSSPLAATSSAAPAGVTSAAAQLLNAVASYATSTAAATATTSANDAPTAAFTDSSSSEPAANAVSSGSRDDSQRNDGPEQQNSDSQALAHDAIAVAATQSNGVSDATATEKLQPPAASASPASPSLPTATSQSDSSGAGTAHSAVQVTELIADEGRGGGSIRRDAIEDDDDAMDAIDIPTNLFEVEDQDSGGRRQNYASLDAGATILDSSPETKSPTNLLVPDKDRYMLMPCEKPRKWVVVSLSEDVHADAIAIANFEKYSSPVKAFIVLGSVTYPTDTWFVLGNFTAAHASGEQVFHLDAQYHVRYIKLRFFSHYGSEYYCTLSQLKVFGRTFTQVISQLEKSIDAEAVLDAIALPTPSPSTAARNDASTLSSSALPSPESADRTSATAGSSSSTSDPSTRDSERTDDRNALAANDRQCALTVATVSTHNNTALYDASQLAQYEFAHGLCRADEVRIPPTAAAAAAVDVNAPIDGAQRPSPAPPTETSNAKRSEPAKPPAGSETRAAANGTAASGESASKAKTNATAPATATSTPVAQPPVPAVSSSSSASSLQGLGRLESIFVRITKKIQALELNQSALGRQIDELQVQQRVAARNVQSAQDAFAEQLKEIRSLLTDLKSTVTKELSGTEQALSRYSRVLDDVQRENIALWNEMVVVREVITTMKAGILCAIVLSALIITVYLLRLLFRCVAACKQRADLREWFWRMEHAATSSSSSSLDVNGGGGGSASSSPVTLVSVRAAVPATSPGSDVSASSNGSGVAASRLRVNRKQQFGTSWDDSAIERKTLMSELLVDNSGPPKHRRPRAKKSRSASLTYGPTIQRIVK